MPGTDLAHGAMLICLPAWYAVPCTDQAHDATRPAHARGAALSTTRGSRYNCSIALTLCYAVSSTEVLNTPLSGGLCAGLERPLSHLDRDRASGTAFPMVLGACYAMCGTDVGCTALRRRYAMSGTDRRYGATTRHERHHLRHPRSRRKWY
eukprot:2914893-Rhodomonas_salina.3